MYKIKMLQVDRMVNEAENLQREDKEMRDAIDTKNHANPVLYILEATKRAGRQCS